MLDEIQVVMDHFKENDELEKVNKINQDIINDKKFKNNWGYVQQLRARIVTLRNFKMNLNHERLETNGISDALDLYDYDKIIDCISSLENSLERELCLILDSPLPSLCDSSSQCSKD